MRLSGKRSATVIKYGSGAMLEPTHVRLALMSDETTPSAIVAPSWKARLTALLQRLRPTRVVPEVDAVAATEEARALATDAEPAVEALEPADLETVALAADEASTLASRGRGLSILQWSIAALMLLLIGVLFGMVFGYSLFSGNLDEQSRQIEVLQQTATAAGNKQRQAEDAGAALQDRLSAQQAQIADLELRLKRAQEAARKKPAGQEENTQYGDAAQLPTADTGRAGQVSAPAAIPSRAVPAKMAPMSGNCNVDAADPTASLARCLGLGSAAP